MNRHKNESRRNRFMERLQAYFGFAEPGLTWRQRCAIFAENERRSWARLMGSRRPGDACRRGPIPPAG